jgi:hypothetical protein
VLTLVLAYKPSTVLMASGRAKRKASAMIRVLTAAAAPQNAQFQLLKTVRHDRLLQEIEGLSFDLRIAKVQYDDARIRLVRDKDVSVAMVADTDEYDTRLFSDTYQYLEGVSSACNVA